jgi:hypothetical protein
MVFRFVTIADLHRNLCEEKLMLFVFIYPSCCFICFTYFVALSKKAHPQRKNSFRNGERTPGWRSGFWTESECDLATVVFWKEKGSSTLDGKCYSSFLHAQSQINGPAGPARS